MLSLSDDYRQPIRMAVYQQIAIAIVCLLLLDGGRMAKISGGVLIGFWTGVALMMVRRPQNPTPVDRALIQYSFVPLLLVSVVIAQLMRR